MPARTPSLGQLPALIADYFSREDLAPCRAAAQAAFAALREALNRGQVRAASPTPDGWTTHAWVKQGILLGFRLGELQPVGDPDAPLRFFDKSTLPPRAWQLADRVRLVPGGSSVRDGAYLAPGVICMPPMYVNIGAYVDEGTLIDSHALVGSCAQVGKRVHLSAAAQLGGVLEPVNAAPVIIEDDVFIGGQAGVFEGVRVERGAVLAAGVVLTRSTPIHDLARETVHRAGPEEPLRVPRGAVVVPGARAVRRGKGPEWGLSLYTPVIVKYCVSRGDGSIALEEWLR